MYRNVHLFIVNNTLTYMIAKKISSELTDDCMIISMSSLLKPEIEAWKKVFIFESKWGRKISNKISMIWESKKKYDLIKEVLQKYSNVHVYLPNIHSPFTNKIFFNLPNELHVNLQYNILVEGSLNYAGHYIGKNYFYKSLIKIILGYMMGFSYKLFQGEFDASDQNKIDIIYAPLKEGLCTNKKIVEIDLSPKKDIKREKNNILIVGQYLSSQLSTTNQNILEEYFLEFINNKLVDAEIIYYKAHPMSDEKDDFIQKLSDERIKIVKTSLSLEEWLENEDVKMVISIASTALMTIKIMYGDKIECISFGMDFLNKNTSVDYASLMILYKKLGVIIFNEY